MDDNISIKNKRPNFRTAFLVIITVLYLLAGAVTFEFLELKEANQKKKLINDKINKFILKYNLTNETFEPIYKVMILRGHYTSNLHWSFDGSFLFSTLVLTVIGYGHITPKTTAGKIFCIIYCLIGIPISMIMFQSAGERFNKFLNYILECFKEKYNFSSKQATNNEIMIIKFFLIIFLILTCSYYFKITEDWTYLESLYYYCITLLTIGFGDYVPLKNSREKNFSYFSDWFLTILFIMFGLTIFASTFNLLVLYIRNLNSEDNIRKQLRLKQKKKQMQQQKMLKGDVISGVNKQDIVTHTDETLNLALFEDASVCSCDDINKCYQLYSNRLKLKRKQLFQNLNKSIDKNNKSTTNHHKLKRIKFTVLRQPCNNIKHLFNSADDASSDLIIKTNQMKNSKTNQTLDLDIKRLAIESDFITNRILNRRVSI